MTIAEGYSVLEAFMNDRDPYRDYKSYTEFEPVGSSLVNHYIITLDNICQSYSPDPTGVTFFKSANHVANFYGLPELVLPESDGRFQPFYSCDVLYNAIQILGKLRYLRVTSSEFDLYGGWWGGSVGAPDKYYNSPQEAVNNVYSEFDSNSDLSLISYKGLSLYERVHYSNIDRYYRAEAQIYPRAMNCASCMSEFKEGFIKSDELLFTACFDLKYDTNSTVPFDSFGYQIEEGKPLVITGNCLDLVPVFYNKPVLPITSTTGTINLYSGAVTGTIDLQPNFQMFVE